MWDLTAPPVATWRAQLEFTINHELCTWASGHEREAAPWRGIRAQVQQPPKVDHNHATVLDIEVNQYIKVVTDMALGTGSRSCSCLQF